jgi:hypothetical protein
MILLQFILPNKSTKYIIAIVLFMGCLSIQAQPVQPNPPKKGTMIVRKQQPIKMEKKKSNNTLRNTSPLF